MLCASLQATCGTLGLSTATVKLIAPDGEEKIACCVGTGPVDAAYKAVDEIIQVCCCHIFLPFLRWYIISNGMRYLDAIPFLGAIIELIISGEPLAYYHHDDMLKCTNLTRICMKM